MSSNIELKKVQTDITSTTEDISIRKQQKTNTLIENQTKNNNTTNFTTNINNTRINFFFMIK